MVLACLVASAPVEAADLFIHTRSSADIDEIITPAYDTVQRRRVVHDLDLVLANLLTTGGLQVAGREREVLRLSFSGRVETDFGREVVRSSPDPRVNEPVDFVLRRLELTVRPAEPVAVRLGRFVLFGPLTPADIDGGAIGVRAHVGAPGHRLSGAVAGGREVRRDIAKLDSGAWDPAGGRFELFDDPLETTWLVQAELGWGCGPVDLRGGHRTRWRHGDVVGQSSAAVARLDLESVRVLAALDWGHLLGSPDRLDAQVRVPFAGPNRQRRSAAWLGWRYERPVFDGDSLFNVFAVTPWVGWRAGADLWWSEVLLLVAEGWLRAYSESEEPDWSSGLGSGDERAGGGSLRGDWTPLPVLGLRASVSAEGGRGGTVLSSELAGRWTVRPRLAELGLRLRHAWRESEQWITRYGHLLAARGRGSYALSSFGRLSVWIDALSDFRYGRSLRVMVAVELDVGPI